MPFTLSHVVLAPPLAQLTRYRLPTAALAIGCMVPDLIRLFIPDNETTHLWSSLIYPNLWIGLGFSALWYMIYRPAIYRFLGLDDPLKIQGIIAYLVFLLGMILAILLGNVSHLIWDGLTHVDNRTFAFHDFLSQPAPLIGHVGREYPLHFVLQIASSVLPLPILVWMGWRYYQQHQQSTIVRPRIKNYFYILLFLSLSYSLFSLWNYAHQIPAELWTAHTYFFTGKSINAFTQGWLMVMTIGCLLFLFLDRNQRMDD